MVIDMIKLATVGTSAICENFLDGMKMSGKFELAAVYSRNEATGAAFAEKYGCNKVFTSLERMAQWDGADAVYIASPNVFHAEQSRIFLKNKKHVICEKPITTNAGEYSELKKLADDNKLIYMEAIIPRHVKNYNAVKKAVNSIGKILTARIDFCQRSSRLDSFLNGDKVNIFDMSLHAGTLMDLGVYCVYGAVDLLGTPTSIISQAHYMSNGADGSGAAIFEYGNFSAVLSYSKVCQGEIGSEIIGEFGTVKIKHISQYSGVSLVKNNEEKIIVGYPSKAELMSGECEKFANYIRNFDEYADDYKASSDLCLSVHKCMDEIKIKAGISYPTYTS